MVGEYSWNIVLIHLHSFFSLEVTVMHVSAISHFSAVG